MQMNKRAGTEAEGGAQQKQAEGGLVKPPKPAFRGLRRKLATAIHGLGTC